MREPLTCHLSSHPAALRYNDQLIGFSSHEALRVFADDPDRVMMDVRSTVGAQLLLARLTGRSGVLAEFPQIDLRVIVNAMSGPLKVSPFVCLSACLLPVPACLPVRLSVGMFVHGPFVRPFVCPFVC